MRKHSGDDAAGTAPDGITVDAVYGEDAAIEGLSSQPLGHYESRAGQPWQVSEYLYIPTAQGPMPVAAEINGQLYAIHTDHLNTPRRLTDVNGHAVWQWAVTAFGELEPTTAETGWIRPRIGNAGQRTGT